MKDSVVLNSTCFTKCFAQLRIICVTHYHNLRALKVKQRWTKRKQHLHLIINCKKQLTNLKQNHLRAGQIHLPLVKNNVFNITTTFNFLQL